MMGWRIDVWTGRSDITEPMTEKEIENAIKYLRENNYPKPDDCPLDSEDVKGCPGLRPACKLGICYVAVRLCGDF